MDTTNTEKTVKDTTTVDVEITRENVIEHVSVKHNDQDDELDLYCYTKCVNDDTEFLKRCRGIIFKKTGELIVQTFPYTEEFVIGNESYNVIKDFFDQCTFYDSHEGALIRVFYHKKWYVSTHRKLDANHSKWASKKSFGQLFTEALVSEYETNEKFKNFVPDGEQEDIINRFTSVLDKTKQYMFHLRNNDENRIVCFAPENPTVYHVGTFCDGKLDMTVDISLPYPQMHEFDSVSSMFDHIDKQSASELQGIVAFGPNNKQYKFMSREYKHLFEIRGNEPSIKFRYLQLRMDKQYVDDLLFLYPNFKDAVLEYENVLYNVAKEIYSSYVNRFINRIHTTVSQEKYEVVRKCHEWHKENKKRNRVNLETVIYFLNDSKPTSLNRMIKKYNAEQYKLSQESLTPLLTAEKNVEK